MPLSPLPPAASHRSPGFFKYLAYHHLPLFLRRISLRTPCVHLLVISLETGVQRNPHYVNRKINVTASSLNVRIIKRKSSEFAQDRFIGIHVIHDCFNGSLISVCLILRLLQRPHQVDFLALRNSDFFPR